MKKIQHKLLILLISVALIPTFITEYFTYQDSKSELQKENHAHLNNALIRTINAMSQLFAQELNNANILSNTPDVIDEFEKLNAQNDYVISPFIEKFLNDIKITRQLHNIYFITQSGHIKFSLDSIYDVDTNIYTSIFNNNHMATLVQRVLRNNEAAHSKFEHHNANDNTLSAFIAHPVSKNNTLLGVVVMELTPNIFDSITRSELSIGKTGEVLLAHLDNNKVSYVSPLHFIKSEKSTLSLDLNSDMSQAMQLAVQGVSGQGESVDYRLQDVFAQWSYIEEFNLGIVAKIDQSQVMYKLNSLQLTIYLITFSIAIPLIIFAYIIARHYTRPIIEMVNSTDAITNGSVDQELKVTSTDEIGQLATSINEMSNHINQAFKNEEAERWLQEGVVKLSETMRGNQISTDLADNIVSFVCGYLNAKVGSLYIVKEQYLELAGGFAYIPHASNQSIEFGDGLVGQVAISKSVMTINTLPEDYMNIASSMGKVAPSTLVIFPLMKDNVVIGVMELGWLDNEHDQTYLYLDAISESMATALSVAESHNKLQILLDQSQLHMEELQVREEELRSINEEVEQRSTQLALSQKKLEQQSQELQATNDALEHKNSEIEISRQEISNKAEQLEASSRYKSEFLANMSHELRTPLNSMLILSRIMADNDEGNLDDDQVESSKIIHRSGQELLSLINDILDLSKIEAGKMEVLYEPYDIRDITYELNGQFKAITSEKGLTFDVLVDNNVPTEMAIEVQKVQQVLKNLLSNSIKFTEQGGVTLSVQIANPDQEFNLPSLSNQAALAISIIDTGIGISEEKQKAIFEAFQQADGSTSRKYGGTGLGLTISRHLTQLIEGELSVESVINQGSTFTLYIPIKDVIENKAQSNESIDTTLTENESDHPSNSFTQLQQHIDNTEQDNKVIVIIEDDINFSKVLASLATKSGFNCVLANTGAQGINLVKEHQPCGVILDLGLPDIPGADVLDILKEQADTCDIPVHVISGHNKTSELTDKGAEAFHQKPIATQDIQTLLYSLVKTSPSQKEQHLFVFDQANSNSVMNLSFLQNTVMNLISVDSLDEMSHNLGNIDGTISGLIIKSQSLSEQHLMWLNDHYHFNNENDIPVIVFLDDEPTLEQVTLLQQLNCHVIINGTHSNERLHDEVLLFLANVEKTTIIKTAADNTETPITEHSLPEPAKLEKINTNQNDEPFDGCEVLLVDDDLRNTFALSKVLKKQGMKVTLADNGQMALERLSVNDSIDIVLMDIMMPVMDGHEAMKQIRLQDQYANLPIIALTAKAMQEDKRKCLEAGASDYLTKPVDIDKLVAMMRVWLYQEVK